MRDLAIVNARITTLDPACPAATALAIRGRQPPFWGALGCSCFA